MQCIGGGGFLIVCVLTHCVVVKCFRKHFGLKKCEHNSIDNLCVELSSHSPQFLFVLIAQRCFIGKFGAMATPVAVLMGAVQGEDDFAVPSGTREQPVGDAQAQVPSSGFSLGCQDPSDEIISGITCMGHALALAGLITVEDTNDESYPGPVGKPLLEFLGMTMDTHIETLTANTIEQVHALINRWQLKNTDGTMRPANLHEMGLAKLVDRYCRLRVGEVKTKNAEQGMLRIMHAQGEEISKLKAELSKVSSASAEAAAEAASRVASLSTPAAEEPKGVSIKEVAAPSAEGVCKPLTPDKILECFKRYEVFYGKDKRPAPHEEPTENQLSVLKHMLDQDMCPYVDFAVWVPFGDRSVKKQKCMGMVITADGKFSNVELAGPANFEIWQSRFLILENALLMLGAVDLGNIQAYSKLLKRYHDKHGHELYALLYQTDVRTRSEQFVRLRRQGYAEYKKTLEYAQKHKLSELPECEYDPARPWNYVFAAAVKKGNAEWWKDEFEDNAIYITSKNSRGTVADALGTDAPIAATQPKPAAPGFLDQPPPLMVAWGSPGGGFGKGGGMPPNDPWWPQPSAKRQRQESRTQHNIQDGKYITNRSQRPLCNDYNEGTCQTVNGQLACPRNPNLVHQCNKCLQQHPASSCPFASATGPSAHVKRAQARAQEAAAAGQGKGKGAVPMWQNYNAWRPNKGGYKGKGRGKKGQY